MTLFYPKFPVEIIIKSLDCCRKSKSYGRKSTCIPWRWFIRRGGTQATLPRFTRYDSFRWRYDYVIFQQCVTAQMNNYMTLNSNIQNRRRKKKIFKNVSVILNVSFQKLSFFETKIAKFGLNFKKFGHLRDKLVIFGQKLVNFGQKYLKIIMWLSIFESANDVFIIDEVLSKLISNYFQKKRHWPKSTKSELFPS